jgi:aerobic-type carbon monoxide dehydrogenase small subunit (CoxS/CutS family)
LNSHAVLLNDPSPYKQTVTEWLSSNICRSTDYKEIEKAIFYSIMNKAPTQNKDG